MCFTADSFMVMPEERNLPQATLWDSIHGAQSSNCGP